MMHTHMPYATALTSIEGGTLEMVSQNCLRFYNRIACEMRHGAVSSGWAVLTSGHIPL